jgi:hypothetical protein
MAHALKMIVREVPVQFQVFGFAARGSGWQKSKDSGRLVCPRTHGRPIAIDPWLIRSEFMALRDEQSLIAFLNQTGRWEDESVEEIEIAEFWGWQQILKEMLLGPKGYQELRIRVEHIDLTDSRRSWDSLDLAEPFVSMTRTSAMTTWDRVLSVLARKFEFPRIDVRPLGIANSHFVVAKTQATLDAILLSVHLDRIQGARFKICARLDCQKIFKVKTDHQRRYCTMYCAHIESVRRNRKKNKQFAERARRSNKVQHQR